VALYFFGAKILAKKLARKKLMKLTPYVARAENYNEVFLKRQGTISSTVYVHLLCAQIPKVQKDTDSLTEFLRFGI